MGLPYLNTIHARRTLLNLENAEEYLIGLLSHSALRRNGELSMMCAKTGCLSLTDGG